MEKTNKKTMTLAITSAIVTVLYTIMVAFFDKGAIGPDGTEVGFSHINKVFLDLLNGPNDLLYKISEILGYTSFLLAAFFAVIGLLQWIKRKSIKKIDSTIIAMGCLFVVLAILYVLFEKVVINYRPIILDPAEWPEASYPSSHTMLSMTICGASMIESKILFQQKLPKTNTVLQIISWVLVVGVVLCRFLSGVHWFTDIIGGILFGLTLIVFFKAVTQHLTEKEKQEKS